MSPADRGYENDETPAFAPLSDQDQATLDKVAWQAQEQLDQFAPTAV